MFVIVTKEMLYLIVKSMAFVMSALYFSKRKVINLSIKRNFTDFKRVKNLVRSTETNIFMIYYCTTLLCTKYIIANFKKKYLVDRNVLKLDDNVYQITYKIEDKEYKLLVQKYRGPCPVMQITDEDDIDVTDVIIPFMGPAYDWHNFKLNGKSFNPPKYFNRKKLTFEMSDCSHQIMHSDGTLTIS